MSAPNAWIELIGHLRRAQVARRGMRDITVAQPLRDAATVEGAARFEAERPALLAEIAATSGSAEE